MDYHLQSKEVSIMKENFLFPEICPNKMCQVLLTISYKNLIIVHKDVHRLIHAVSTETIQMYTNKIKPNKSQLEKINKLRILAGNPEI